MSGHVPQLSEDEETDFERWTGLSDEAVKAQTGLSWSEWLEELDVLGAQQLGRTQLERLIAERWPRAGAWWAHALAVGYVRLRGSGVHRVAGRFQASRSRSLPAPVDIVFLAFSDSALRALWMLEDPALRSANQNQSLSFAWPDGTAVHVSFAHKSRVRTVVTVHHYGLARASDALEVRAAWDERMTRLREALVASA